MPVLPLNMVLLHTLPGLAPHTVHPSSLQFSRASPQHLENLFNAIDKVSEPEFQYDIGYINEALERRPVVSREEVLTVQEERDEEENFLEVVEQAD